MNIRTLKREDIPALRAMAQTSGYPYPDPTDPHIECIIVVTDENDKPVMAYEAKRVVESYLLCASGLTPHQKMGCLRMIREMAAPILRANGYDSVEAFLPDALERSFGRRLVRSFGAIKNWASYNLKL